jgi:hypothetical protein
MSGERGEGGRRKEKRYKRKIRAGDVERRSGEGGKEKG